MDLDIRLQYTRQDLSNRNLFIFAIKVAENFMKKGFSWSPLPVLDPHIWYAQLQHATQRAAFNNNLEFIEVCSWGRALQRRILRPTHMAQFTVNNLQETIWKEIECTLYSCQLSVVLYRRGISWNNSIVSVHTLFSCGIINYLLFIKTKCISFTRKENNPFLDDWKEKNKLVINI